MKNSIIWGAAGFFGTILIVAIIAYLQRLKSEEETPSGIENPMFSEEESRAGIIEIDRDNQTRLSR